MSLEQSRPGTVGSLIHNIHQKVDGLSLRLDQLEAVKSHWDSHGAKAKLGPLRDIRPSGLLTNYKNIRTFISEPMGDGGDLLLENDKALADAFQGTWSSSTAYLINQIVIAGGSSYICIANNTNHSPPNATYWTALSTATDLTAINAELVGLQDAVSTKANESALADYLPLAGGIMIGSIDLNGTTLYLNGGGTWYGENTISSDGSTNYYHAFSHDFQDGNIVAEFGINTDYIGDNGSGVLTLYGSDHVGFTGPVVFGSEVIFTGDFNRNGGDIWMNYANGPTNSGGGILYMSNGTIDFDGSSQIIGDGSGNVTMYASNVTMSANSLEVSGSVIFDSTCYVYGLTTHFGNVNLSGHNINMNAGGGTLGGTLNMDGGGISNAASVTATGSVAGGSVSTQLYSYAGTYGSYVDSTNNIQTTTNSATMIYTQATATGLMYYLTIDATCRRTSGTENAVFQKRYLITNVAGTVTVTSIGTDLVVRNTLTTATVAVVASGTNIVVQVTGESSKTINWCVESKFLVAK